jgi:CRP-like cAMP-binding protein
MLRLLSARIPVSVVVAALLLLPAAFVGFGRVLVDHVRGLKLHRGLERLARFLVQSSPVNRGNAVFKLEHDRKTIAAMLGISPEFVSRGLQQLRQHGVRARGSLIQIDDVDQISRLYRAIERPNESPDMPQP